MATETAGSAKKAGPGPEAAKSAPPYTGMWDTALNFQRECMRFWMQPAGVMAGGELRERWHAFGTQWLDHAKRATELANDFVGDQVGFARTFADKSFEMAAKLGQPDARDVAPDFARECFDTARKSLDRGVRFGTDSMKVAQDLGVRAMETMTEPVTASC